MTNLQERHVILAAVAFDETGECALLESARHAQLQQGAELHVVHVATGQSDSKSSEIARGQIGELLKARVEQVQMQRPLKVTAHLRTGPAARAILQTAADIDADLIVVGTHKRTGMEKLVLGSVAESVLRDAHCPVLVAMPKDYAHASESDTIEPVCPDCANARHALSHPTDWCERHSRIRPRPHVYEPSGARHPGPLEM